VIEEVYDALLLSVNNPLDFWVLDSGASFYVARDFGKVYLADRLALDIVGMGDVRIKGYSDSVWKM
jgi:hypothetical protein